MPKGLIASILIGSVIGTVALLIKSGKLEDKSVTYEEIGETIKDLDKSTK